MAILEIPRLKVSSVILSGDGASVLDKAIGHLPDTPLPWEPGNSALAAHRDGLFRPLRGIRHGDEIRVRSARGEQTYRVRETKIVTPDDLSVLEPASTDMLTLITCYPFNFVGNAPKRFIVHAERIGLTTPSP
jgi:sortase A